MNKLGKTLLFVALALTFVACNEGQNSVASSATSAGEVTTVVPTTAIRAPIWRNTPRVPRSMLSIPII